MNDSTWQEQMQSLRQEIDRIAAGVDIPWWGRWYARRWAARKHRWLDQLDSYTAELRDAALARYFRS